MREKFDRNNSHINIGEVGVKSNETPEEKIARIKETKKKFAGIPVDPSIKAALNAVLDKSLEELDQQNTVQEDNNTHRR